MDHLVDCLSNRKLYNKLPKDLKKENEKEEEAPDLKKLGKVKKEFEEMVKGHPFDQMVEEYIERTETDDPNFFITNDLNKSQLRRLIKHMQEGEVDKEIRKHYELDPRFKFALFSEDEIDFKL